MQEKPVLRPMQVKVDAKLYEAASKKAKDMGLTLSQVVRFQLKEWVASRQEKMFF